MKKLVNGSPSSIIRTGRESKNKWKRGFATKKEALGFERDFLKSSLPILT
ncbi:MAG: Arm DNA-binding domain-containing protein [Blautia producta]